MEDVAYDKLQAYLVRTDRNATLVTPSRLSLTAIIRDGQNAARPTGPYAMIELLTDRDSGEVDSECYREEAIASGAGGATEARVIAKKSRGVEYLFRVHCYASRAVDYANVLLAGLRLGEAQVWLAPLGIRALGHVQRGIDVVQQKYEGRAFFDVTLGAIVTVDLPIDVIETGKFVFRGDGGSIVETELPFVKPTSP